MVRDFFRAFKILFQMIRVIRHIQWLDKNLVIEKTSRQKVIVINSVRSYIPIQMMIESYFALILVKRGHIVHLLLDDGYLESHDTRQVASQNIFSQQYIVKLCNLLIEKSSLGSYITFNSELAYKEQFAKSDNINCSEHTSEYVQASIVRYFNSAPDDLLLAKEKHYETVRRFYEMNERLSRGLATNVLTSLEPDLVISSHGIYTSWGSFLNEVDDSGVDYITWGGNGFTSGLVDFSRNDIAANKLDGGYFEFLKNSDALRDKAILKGKECILKRTSHSADDQKRLRKNNTTDNIDYIHHLKSLKDNGKKIVSIFPNVMWDNATTFKSSNTIFDSPVQWLIETALKISNLGNYHLVIRVHPAENGFMSVRASVMDILKLYNVSLNNITLIPASSAVRSLDLVAFSDVCSVYNGTIGLEIIELDKPLLVASRAAYSLKGFTFDCNNKEDYFKSLQNEAEILNLQVTNKELFYLFCCEYFFLHGVPIPYISSVNPLEPNFNSQIDARRATDIARFFEGELEFSQEISNYDF